MQAEIARLIALINGLQRQLPLVHQVDLTQIPSDYRFTKQLYYGQKSDDVRYLQIFLKSQGTAIYPEAISTGWYGPATKKAVIRFQEQYKSDILSPKGMTNGTGIVGAGTNQKINEIMGR